MSRNTYRYVGYRPLPAAVDIPATFKNRRRQHHVRGRVWITGSTVHYEVNLNGVRVLYDNTGVKAWREMLLLATAGAETIRRQLTAGNTTITEYSA